LLTTRFLAEAWEDLQTLVMEIITLALHQEGDAEDANPSLQRRTENPRRHEKHTKKNLQRDIPDDTDVRHNN